MSTITEEKTLQKVNDDNNDEIKYKIEKATETLERNIGFITNCDTKTSIVLTAIGVLLTIILTNDGLKKIFSIVKICFDEKSFSNSIYLICFGVAVLILLLGIYNLVSVLIARTDIKSKGINSSNSNVFFVGISKNKNFETYKEKFYLMNQHEFLDEILAEIYANAYIATIKYNKYNVGLTLTIIGFILFVIILLVAINIFSSFSTTIFGAPRANKRHKR